jgi:hypothetical protein
MALPDKNTSADAAVTRIFDQVTGEATVTLPPSELPTHAAVLVGPGTTMLPLFVQLALEVSSVPDAAL